ncbi:integrase, catalytic region, zinc finger, CCHC-type containing protein [Tanacetum coccineum]|uniref:Integrase, catalytic region, zinc finger, CCHC-type containing protein n=1 Tax=Tanacetum coccineum TaxID=301880 RepID=A0ABQ5GBP9_9ASTR
MKMRKIIIIGGYYEIIKSLKMRRRNRFLNTAYAKLKRENLTKLGRVTVQPVQGRQIFYAAGTTRTFTPGASANNSEKQRIVTCYNCKGEGHMSKQFTKPRTKWDDSWFKDKVLLVQAQASGQILHEEECTFFADIGILE